MAERLDWIERMTEPIPIRDRPADELWEQIEDALNFTWQQEPGRLLADASMMGMDEDQVRLIWAII